MARRRIVSLASGRGMPTGTSAGLHLWGDCRGFGPEVFLEDQPLLRDDEGLDAGRLVLSGIGDQRQTSLTATTSVGCGNLCHDSEVVPMEGAGLVIVSIRRAGGQALGESGDWVFASCLGVGCILYHYKFFTHFNCGGLVFSNSSEQDLLLAAIRIEIPFTVLGDQRDGEGPVLCTDVQNRASVGFSDQAVHLLIFFGELLALQSILDFVA